MHLFHPANRSRSPGHERIYALYEIWYTAVDFAAAFLFIIGSILFFWESTQFEATWMFVIGSVCFAMKPTIRLVRELHYARLGDYEKIVKQEAP